MNRDHELRTLRAYLERLESELADARKHLESLEADAAPRQPVPQQAVPAPSEAVVAPTLPAPAPQAPTPVAPAPVPPAAPARPAAAPPPLPWERPKPVAPPPLPASAVAKSAEEQRPVPPLQEAPDDLDASHFSEAPAGQQAAPVIQEAVSPRKPFADAPARKRRFGPPEDMPLEMALGTWWLPRIGIVVLSVGVVFLLTWAANNIMSSWMRPYLQVAGGYAVCAALLTAARRLEGSARNYARVLASGGFALSYFVTFAAHFVVDPPVIASEFLTGLLLFAIVLVWGGVAQRRKSPLLALGVTLLGHLTIFLSLRSADTGELFSIAALLLFSLGSAFFLVKNRWYGVGAAGMLCSYVNLGALLSEQVFVTHGMAATSAAMLLGAVYAVFALAELFAPEELRRRDVRLSLRSAFVAVNSFCALGLAWLLWNRSGAATELPGIHVLYGAAGVIVLVIARLYYHARSGDPLYNIYQIKGLSLVTLALAKYLSGEQLAVTLAVEALLLLLNSATTGFIVSRAFSWICAALSSAVMCFVLWNTIHATGAGQPKDGVFYAMWITFALLHAAGVVYGKVNWRTRGVCAELAPLWARSPLRQLDLLDMPPITGKLDSPASQSPWPLLFSNVALLPWLLWMFAGNMASPVWRGEGFAALSLLALGALGVLLNAPNLTRPVIFAAAAFVAAIYAPGLAIGVDSSGLAPRDTAIVALCLFLLAEAARLSRVRCPGLWFELPGAPRITAHGFALFASAPLLHALFDALPREQLPAACAAAALLFALYTAATNAVFWQTAVIFQGIAAFGACIRISDAMDNVGWLQIGAMSALLLVAQLRIPEGRQGLVRLRQPLIAGWISGCLVLVLFVQAWHLPGFWPPYAFVALVGLLCGLAVVFDPRVFTLLALGAVAGAAMALGFDTSLPQDTHWKLGMAAIAAVAIAVERVMRLKGVWIAWRLHDIAVLVGLLVTLRLLDVSIEGPFAVTVWFAAVAAFLGYAARGELFITGAVAMLFAAMATALAAQGQIPRLAQYPIVGPLATTGAAALFWALSEWALRTRATTKNLRDIANLLALLACGLFLRMLHQVDALANFYLTIAWTLAAVVMIVLGAGTGQAYYRYGGLATFAVVVARAALWDTRNLDLIVRVVSFMLLGAVLLAVAYGYIRAAAATRPRPEAPKAPPPPTPGDDQPSP